MFGVNSDPVIGGAFASGLTTQRRDARQRIRGGRPLVSAADFAEAALGLGLLEVARAWVVMPDDKTPRTGTVKLVAMRSRAGGVEPASAPETSRWLDAIRRTLVPSIPLGIRLAVVAPHYLSFSIAATLETDRGRNPATIEESATNELHERLALVSSDASAPVRQPGVPLSERDVGAWLRTVDGVRRVTALRLIDAHGQDQQQIAVPPSGLPRWDSVASQIKANRP